MSQAKEIPAETAPPAAAPERPAASPAAAAKPAAVVAKPAAVAAKPKPAPARGEVVNLAPGAEPRAAPPAHPKARHRLALWSYVVAPATSSSRWPSPSWSPPS